MMAYLNVEKSEIGERQFVFPGELNRRSWSSCAMICGTDYLRFVAVILLFILLLFPDFQIKFAPVAEPQQPELAPVEGEPLRPKVPLDARPLEVPGTRGESPEHRCLPIEVEEGLGKVCVAGQDHDEAVFERGVQRPPEAEVDGGGDVGQVQVVPRPVPQVAREERLYVAHAVRVEQVGHVEVVDLEPDRVPGRVVVIGDVDGEPEEPVLEGGPVDGDDVDLDPLTGRRGHAVEEAGLVPRAVPVLHPLRQAGRVPQGRRVFVLVPLEAAQVALAPREHVGVEGHLEHSAGRDDHVQRLPVQFLGLHHGPPSIGAEHNFRLCCVTIIFRRCRHQRPGEVDEDDRFDEQVEPHCEMVVL